jgi:hypothetical protein
MAATADASSATAELPRDPKNPDEPDSRYMDGRHMELQGRVFDTLIMCFVKSWSLDLPVTTEALEDLDTGTKDALLKAAMEKVTELMPDFGDNPADPKATSGGSTPPRTGSSTEEPTFEIPSYAPTS